MHLSLWVKRTGLLYYQLRYELNCLIHSRHIQRPRLRGLMSWWNTVRHPLLNLEVIFADKSRSQDRGVHLFSMAASLWNEPNNHILRPPCLEWYCSLPCNITTQRHETSNSPVSNIGVESTPAVCWVYSSSQRSSWKWGAAAGSFWSDDQCCGDTCCYRGNLCPLKKQQLLTDKQHERGNMKMLRMHIDGLKRMVGIRGGLNAIRETNPMVANSTFWWVSSRPLDQRLTHR